MVNHAVIVVLAIIVWILDAIRDAAVDHRRWNERDPALPANESALTFDEHVVFKLHRMAIALIIFYSFTMVGSYAMAFVCTFGIGLMFPFIHDGIYYVYRNGFSRQKRRSVHDPLPYPKGFKAVAEDGDSMTYKTRSFLFYAGTVIYWVAGHLL